MAKCLKPIIALKPGSTWRLEFVWTEDGNTKIDITGATAQMHIRDAYGRVKISEPSSITYSVPNASVTAEFSSTVTALIPVGTYFADILLTFPGGDKAFTQTVALPVERAMTRS